MNSSGSIAPGPKRPTGKAKSPNSQNSEGRSKEALTPSVASPSVKFSKLEVELARQLTLAQIPFIQELSPIPGRKFRFDFACKNLLIEVQGGIWTKGGHSSGAGISRDCEKGNLAVIHGWRVLHVTSEQIKNGLALRWIQQCLTTT